MNLYVVLAALGILALGEGFLCWHVYRDGEDRIEAADKAGADRQRSIDASTNKTTEDALRADNAKLAATLAQPALHVLCKPEVRYVRTGPAPASPQPSQSPDSGSHPAVLPGDSSGVDVGPAVQDLRDAALVLADYRERTWQWAVSQGK